MMIKEVECKSLLNRSRLEDYCINPYIGCQHSCKYCYAESYTQRFSHHKEAWGDFVDVKINAPDILARDVKRKPKGTVFFSSLTDAYQPLEREYGLTRRLLEILLQHHFPISIQTKSVLVLRDLDLIKKFHKREVGFTLTVMNDDLRRFFEPASSSVDDRLKAIKKFKENGVKTFVFFGPILPFISDENFRQSLCNIKDAGVDFIYFDKLNLKPNLWPKLEGILQRDFPPLHKKWEKTLLAKSNYYEELKMNIRNIVKELKLDYRFCF